MKLAASIFSIALLVGCAGGGPFGRSWPATDYSAPKEVDRLLAYHVSLTQLKAAELAQEYDRIRRAYTDEPGHAKRIQLALLLSHPGAPNRDDAAALALLRELLADDSTDARALRPLANLLRTYIVDVKRAEEAFQSQSAKLRDEQRRSEALQQKLEALLEMEMKMIEREQSTQPRKR